MATDDNRGGTFYTPDLVSGMMADHMADYVVPIQDPACGTGGILIQVKRSPTRMADARMGEIPEIPAITQTLSFDAENARSLLEILEGFLVEAAHREQIAGDAKLFAALQSVGFEGPVWETFKDKLLKYGMGVLEAWMCAGHLFEMFKHKGIVFTPSVCEADRIIYDTEFRTSLVNMAAMTALHTFRRRCLEGTGWRTDGGAALTTYFAVACLHATANELSKQRRADERARKIHQAALRHEITRPSQDFHIPDPSQEAIDQLILHEYMAELSPRDRNIVWGKACGYSTREIAEIYGERSARVVEQRWSTLAKNVEWIGRLAGKEPK
ncbi:N-6 DNA methylase [Nocardia sp. NPDC020380]|uniref:N-6 DNA methylase n=1 Tax=Nocardia sp. NPDC020380 TaxID=3364309 RepID=UPI003799BD6E